MASKTRNKLVSCTFYFDFPSGIFIITAYHSVPLCGIRVLYISPADRAFSLRKVGMVSRALSGEYLLIVGTSAYIIPQRGVSGAQQENSLSKSAVKHDRMWSPHGRVTVLWSRHCVPNGSNFPGVKILCRLSAPRKVLQMRLYTEVSCEYACKKITYTH